MNEHNRKHFKSLVAINLAAWTAGGYLAIRNCSPALEPPVRGPPVAAPSPQTSMPPAPAATSSCSGDACVFALKPETESHREDKLFWLAQLGAAFSSAYGKLGVLEIGGKPPVLMPSDPDAAALVRAMVRVNEIAGSKYGYEPIPVSGPDERERFRSLNRWLGRGEDLPLDGDAIRRLDFKVVEAVMQ
ncbi:MAG TPA: hypothetical protein VLD37_00880 [Candidatus Bilamarchaeum sp.]|nr:hypothetical protein [Candidatus Bilamarchaeum sp.]